MTQVATMQDIAVDVKSLLEALSEREIRFNSPRLSLAHPLVAGPVTNFFEPPFWCGKGFDL